jgi:hypothetical protein
LEGKIRTRNRNLRRGLITYLIVGIVIILAIQFLRFRNSRNLFPPGSEFASIQVGGLSIQEAEALITNTYFTRLEIVYGGNVSYLDPAKINFQLDISQMLTDKSDSRNGQRDNLGFEFWNYLRGVPETPLKIPLYASYSRADIEDYLREEVAGRYDIAPIPSVPVAGTTTYQTGDKGLALDIDQSIPMIEHALLSPIERRVVLPINEVDPPRPSMSELEVMLKTLIDSSGFDGITSLYMIDLESLKKIHFIYHLGNDYPTPPDVAFTASGIIKIPILVSAFRRIGEHSDKNELRLLENSIIDSNNYQADVVIEQFVDPWRGPLKVTRDMRELGLENTFMAGYFSPGSKLLDLVKTQANQRNDVNTNPDIFNQTTSSEIGLLLKDIYLCSLTGEGAIMETYKGEVSRRECHIILNLLSRNQQVSLISRGVPEGNNPAHMHGWETVSGIMYTLGDAAIINSPGGDYVLVIFLYQPVQLIWGIVTELIEDLSQAVYNYYNIPTR